MKKVLIVITTAFCTYGGLTSVMMNYYRLMDKTGLQIDFVSSNKIDNDLKAIIDSNGSRYYQLPCRKKKTLHYCLEFNKLLKNSKYDIIHVNGNSATMVIELLLAKKNGVSQRIAHVHNSRSNYPAFNALLSLVFHSTYTVAAAVSKQAGDWLYERRPYIVINNAINTERFKYDLTKRCEYRKALDLENSFVVGNIGKINPQKNQKYLLDIFYELRRQRKDAKLLIVGDGALRSELEQRIKQLDLQEDVILLGMRTDVAELLQVMDVFVFPSIFEGLPLSLIEAQSSGLYCFCSNTVSNEAEVSDNIRYLPLKVGANDWARLIQSHEFGDREKLSESARESIKENGYEITTEVNKLRELYVQ